MKTGIRFVEENFQEELKQMPVQEALSKKTKYQKAAVLTQTPPKGSTPVKLLEGPVRDVDGSAVAGKDGPAAMKQVVQEVLIVAHPLCLTLQPLLLDNPYLYF